MNERQLLKHALDHIAEAISALYETTTTEYQAFCFVVDSALKLGTVLYHGDSILDASANWESYEKELYDRFQKKLKAKKKAHAKIGKKVKCK
jgi:hypothetical protein